MPPIRTLAKEHVANARLIAAAPEMLKMLKLIRSLSGASLAAGGWKQGVDDLIQKATGNE